MQTRKKSESQMGFDPTTLRDLVACSTTKLLGLCGDHVVVISLLVYSFRRLVGRISICLNVTA